MSDVQLLFLVLAIIYGWECAWWICRGSIVFRNWLGGKSWQVVQPNILLGNRLGGFVFGNPLPPLGTMLHSSEFPVLLSPEGFAVAQIIDSEPPVASAKWLDWKQITKVEVKGKNILINTEKMLNADSVVLAETVSKLLIDLKQSKPEKREEKIRKWLNQTFDTAGLREKWNEFSKQTRSLALGTNALFCQIFVVSPIIIGVFGFRRSWLVLLVALFALTSSVAVLFHRAHKKLYPRLHDERFTHFIITLLSPATAIRVRDVLSRPLFTNSHPLALTRIFCPPEKFRAEAAEYLRKTLYWKSPETGRGEGIQEVENFWLKLRQTVLEHFLQKNGLEPSALLIPPAQLDPACVSFCPRCLAQFTTTNGVCDDCGGLALQPLKPSAPL